MRLFFNSDMALLPLKGQVKMIDRRGWPFKDWPQEDKRLWQSVFKEGDILDERGPGALWAPTTINNTRKAYGYWLYWLIVTKQLDRQLAPLDRLTPDRIKSYIDDFVDDVASLSAFVYILDLLRFVQAIDSRRDWQWLKNIKNRLWARALPARDKAPIIRPSGDLFGLGRDLMNEADRHTCRYNPYAPDVQYRDGLIMALLAARPFRLKNLASIQLGTHLRLIGNTFWLIFKEQEVKNHKYIEVPLPPALTGYLNRYLKKHRPRLLDGSVSKYLWISRFGNPLTDKSIRHQLKARTKSAFGIAITPHLFRDCAATSIAIHDPDQVRMAATLLGHYTLETTQKYYDQSQMLAAGRVYQAHIMALRNENTEDREQQ